MSCWVFVLLGLFSFFAKKTSPPTQKSVLKKAHAVPCPPTPLLKFVVFIL